MRIELDGSLMTDRKKVHDMISDKLALPEYYGRNLDALYDILTDVAQPLEIVVTHAAQMESALGNYGRALLHTLKDAASANPNLTVSVLAD